MAPESPSPATNAPPPVRPIKLSRTPGGARSQPPKFNQHGREVLLARGFTEEEIAALENDGVIVQTRRK